MHGFKTLCVSTVCLQCFALVSWSTNTVTTLTLCLLMLVVFKKLNLIEIPVPANLLRRHQKEQLVTLFIVKGNGQAQCQTVLVVATLMAQELFREFCSEH